VAALVAARPDEVVFTSGATESNNLALRGLAAHGRAVGRAHVLSTAVEHPAVLGPLAALRADGFDVELLPVTPGGWVDPDRLRQRVRPDTLVVSVMHANNETGVVQPVAEAAAAAHAAGALFHTDAAQTFGKEVDALRRVRWDLLSVSGHKIHGPMGVGVLVVRRTGGKRPLARLVVGGGQELGLRAGTVPVPLVVGLGAAADLAGREHAARAAAAAVKTELLAGLAGVEYVVNGDPARTQPHVLNLRFPGVDGEALMLALRDVVAVSNGAACTSSKYEPSHVLAAMGLTPEVVAESVRLSWGPGVDRIPAGAIAEAVRALTG
jgi:cysteine desulfurase